MEMIRDRAENTLIIRISGRLDANTAPELEYSLNESNEQNIILDMEQLSYMSSAGLRVLFSASKERRLDGRALCCCSVHRLVEEVIDISGGKQFITLYDDLDAALKDRP